MGTVVVIFLFILCILIVKLRGIRSPSENTGNRFSRKSILSANDIGKFTLAFISLQIEDALLYHISSWGVKARSCYDRNPKLDEAVLDIIKNIKEKKLFSDFLPLYYTGVIHSVLAQGRGQQTQEKWKEMAVFTMETLSVILGEKEAILTFEKYMKNISSSASLNTIETGGRLPNNPEFLGGTQAIEFTQFCIETSQHPTTKASLEYCLSSNRNAKQLFSFYNYLLENHETYLQEKAMKYFGDIPPEQLLMTVVNGESVPNSIPNKIPLDFFKNIAKELLSYDAILNENIQKQFAKDLENGLSPREALLNSYVFDLAFRRSELNPESLEIKTLHSEAMSNLGSCKKNWFQGNNVSMNYFLTVSELIHNMIAPSSFQKEIEKDVLLCLSGGIFNAEQVMMNSKKREVFNNLEHIEAALVFINPEIVISKEESHLNTLCSKYAALLSEIIVDKSNTSKSYHQTGDFYNPEGLLLSAICSYMHILLPCDLEKISRLAVRFYYGRANKTITEETFIMNSCYIDYLADQANEKIPEWMHDLKKCIALFVAYPSNESSSQLLEAYQNITEIW